MKEVTEWDNNPRMMWVWDDEPELKRKRKVIYIMNKIELKGDVYPVCILAEDGIGVARYKHCAEIEK